MRLGVIVMTVCVSVSVSYKLTTGSTSEKHLNKRN
jgi:hypothetical protein